VVAQRILDSGIAGELVAALDVWSAFAVKDSRVKWVLAVARQIDPDPVWRDRARDPVVRSDRAALERLAALAVAPDQSPQLIFSLSLHLERTGGDARGLLRQAWQRHPDDFWLALHLFNVLNKQKEYAEAAGYCRAALALRPTSSLHHDLALILDSQGKWEEAIQELRLAIQLDPKLPVHYTLGKVLNQQGKHEEALQELRLALEQDPKGAWPHNLLGMVLDAQGEREEAIEEYRLAIQLDPKYAHPHLNLGNVLYTQGKLEQAIQEYRHAIQLDPKDAAPHFDLGNVLYTQGKLAEAIQEYRDAIQLDSKSAGAHMHLGNVLRDQGKWEEALEEYRHAILLDPKSALPHYNLGHGWSLQGKREQAVQEYRHAIQLDPKLAAPHNGLGIVLGEQGKQEEAIQQFRLAIQLDPRDALPRSNLGFHLAAKGQFDEAIQQFQQAASLGNVVAREQAPRCERLRDLKRRLPAVLDGKDRPQGAQEMLAFADLCYQPFLKNYAAAARFYSDAFTANAKLADDWTAQNRYNAACCAALAGCGQGSDAARLGDQEKARLRQQALDWLKTDLAHWSNLAQSSKPEDGALVRQLLQHWQEDSDLAGVRGDALAKLPQTERDAWKKLWADVEAVLTRTR
jgi:tetratricopeptide (TPR) repeat protein